MAYITPAELTEQHIAEIEATAGRDIDIAICCSEARLKPDTQYPAHRQYARERICKVWNYRHCLD